MTIPSAQTSALWRLNGALEKLAHTPLIGRLRPEIAPEVCSFPVDDYVIFFLALEDGIDVVRFVHGSRDLARLC